MALREAGGLNGSGVTLDGTPLLGARTGVGRYVERLTAELADRDDLQLSATAFTIRAGHRPADLPASVGWVHRRMSARLLQAVWGRFDLPPVEWLAGRADLFHATNFVMPPTRHARGVVTVHDLSFLRYPDTVSSASARYRALVPRSLARAEVVCTPSHAVAAELAAEYRVDPQRIVATPLGVDDEWFTATPRPAEQLQALGLPDRYLVAVGTLEPRKNLPALIAAYRQVRSRNAAAPPLALVGPAGWGPALDLSSLPSGSVITTGYLSTDLLRGVIASSAGLVFPSVYEGFGLPPLEALACGRPVVASDLEVTREVLGNAAILAPSGDVEALAQAIEQLVAIDPSSDAERTAAIGRREHARRWTWHACAEATVEAYRLALSAAP
jgi:glycosyltransferase involved in cell wall biosynthesis